ncbi:MAG TPA: SAM-dependent DNA methyltransferase [bacterium]|nr:SAM-dependent DNA methyltransferase [bacterium]
MNADAGDWQTAALRHQQHLATDARKQRGVWFTPPELAAPTARRALAPLVAEPRPLRICDPAVGGGSFLRAAAEVLDNADGRHTFVGVDVDERATQIARLALRAVTATVDVRRGDGLLDLDPESFDCVLTNPPWETLQHGDDVAARVAALRPRFRHQGKGKLFTYRLFVERAVQLLRPGGRLGMIVPASLWFDRGAEPLRRLLLDTCDWQWLFGFENRARIFDIDSRYRFGVVIATKGGHTRTVQVAFGRTSLAEWNSRAPAATRYGRRELQRLSPHSGAFVEIEERRDLDILTRLQAYGRPLLGPNGAFAWRQGDFNMTADRHQFVSREAAERGGYEHDGRGTWRKAGAPDLLPLRQGAMIYDLDGNAGAHATGSGHRTKWRRPAHRGELRPLYLIEAEAWHAGAATRPPARIALRALSNATNERTAIACLLPDVPCGNSLGVLTPNAPTDTPIHDLAAGAAMLASLPFDWALRMRMGGTNLNQFVLTDCVLPRVDDATRRRLAWIALRLCAPHPWCVDLWENAQREGLCTTTEAPATDAGERRALQTEIDHLIAKAFRLDLADIEWITRGQPFRKGFWRVERDLPPSERRPQRLRMAIRGSSGTGAGAASS